MGVNEGAVGGAGGGRLLAIAALVFACAVSLSLTTARVAAAQAQVNCATTLPATPSSAGVAGAPCWSDVVPYPFGADGNPVDTSPGSQCAPTSTGGDPPSCYLNVTSMAFRAWNRGLAATSPELDLGSGNAFGVWIWNGTRWFPDPTFPGSSSCPGTTVVWAGKLDYWLIGGVSRFSGGSNQWPSLCRFDGVNFIWEPLAVPRATLDRIRDPNNGSVPAGSITSASCFAWDNCWFFGTYGTILHWDGNQLTDASPDPALGWLNTAFSSAIAHQDAAGNLFGVAVGASGSDARSSTALPAQPDGSAPPQMFGSSGGAFSPLSFTPPTSPLPGDPHRTDLVSVDFDSSGQGWVAGNPAGLRAGPGASGPSSRGGGRVPSGTTFPAPEPSPLVPISPNGSEVANCAGPASNTFTYTNASSQAANGSFLWESISVLPTTGDALAGGQMWPATAGPGPNEDGSGEPLIATAGCDGTTSTTRFRIADPTYNGTGTAPQVAADRAGTVSAIAANAVNDVWAATGPGYVPLAGVGQQYRERPHLYRFTDGQAPDAPAGDNNEQRPLNLQLDAPTVIVLPPAPEPPAPAPVGTVKQSRTVSLPSAWFHVRSRLRGHKQLVLTFRLRRPVRLGAQGLRNGHVVASTALRRFTGKAGELVLNLNPRLWPNQIRFVTDAPQVSLKDPGKHLTGTVNLVAVATPYRGRRIVAVRFEYTPSGKQLWTPISTVTAAPWRASFDTTTLARGSYDLRVIATDSSGQAGASQPVTHRRVG